MNEYQSVRLNMVESQVRPNKVTDPAILDALLAVPRERFVPESLRGIAYVDEDVPLGGGRYLMEPMVFARLLQFAEIGSGDGVLDVGCALGYSAAVLARIARRVVAVEDDKGLLPRARALLADVGNVTLVETPLAGGCPQHASYDVILLEGAVGSVPAAIAEQLAEGGRLVTVLYSAQGMGKAVLMTRRHGIIGQRIIFDAGTPLLPGFAPQPEFVF
ncbi:MAG: protein-L-isoaspartate O-methyltransferase [Rhodospirillales bacterium]|nr:protein-L-isoaspartate O-methyltransferase [Rhodospirillales bacterium]